MVLRSVFSMYSVGHQHSWKKHVDLTGSASLVVSRDFFTQSLLGGRSGNHYMVLQPHGAQSVLLLNLFPFTLYQTA